MPTVLRIGPDANEPPHVHVKRDQAQAKFWLEPQARLEWQRGFAARELNVMLKLAIEHREFLLGEWRGRFPR